MSNLASIGFHNIILPHLLIAEYGFARMSFKAKFSETLRDFEEIDSNKKSVNKTARVENLIKKANRPISSLFAKLTC